MSNFLIVEQDKELRSDICYFFHSIGQTIHQASDPATALRLMEDQDFDVVIGDVQTAGGAILDLVRTSRSRKPETAVIVTSGIETIQEGVQAVKEGAFTLLKKPFSLPELNFQAKRALGQARKPLEPESVPQPLGPSFRPYNFLGESPQIRKVLRIVEKVAGADSNVLITGETGTGKELVAAAIHYNSARADGPFVRVNCAALPEPLLESELFGHEKGAFTGAERQRIGRFEQADGGTIFLDEIADMSLYTQAKVLRVVQEKEFERVGSNQTIKTDVRLISATNRELMRLIQDGSFREDLFYRLNVVSIPLPPLRERQGDLELLVRFFLAKYSSLSKKSIRGIEPAAMDMLRRYPWPGNIRELENTLERAVLMAERQTISVDDLSLLSDPGEATHSNPLSPSPLRLEEAERRLILEALERCGWVQRQAAEQLGISSRTLNYKIKRYGITHPHWRRHR